MSTIGAKYNSYVLPGPPRVLYAKAAADTVSTGTYQVTNTNLYGRRLTITCNKALRVQGGTGSSVTSTGTAYVPADTPFTWVPKAGMESLGWVTADAANITYLSIYTQDTLGIETI